MIKFKIQLASFPCLRLNQMKIVSRPNLKIT